jgi:putative nucleotidyltransferase with HDIG domain
MKTANKPRQKEAAELYERLERHLLEDGRPSEAVRKLSETPAFAEYPFSMLLRQKSTNQSPRYHPEGSVWNHTLLVIDEAAQRRHLSGDARAFMWAALLHDIGKPDTTRNRNGKITAYAHDTAGEKLTRAFLSMFTDDGEFIDKTAVLVRYHMHILYVIKELPFKDVGGMKRRSDLREVALLGLCDRLGRTGAVLETEEEQVRRFIQLCEKE